MLGNRTALASRLARAVAITASVACMTLAVTIDAPAQADPPGAEPGLPYLRCLPNPPGTPEDVSGSCATDEYANRGSFLNFPQVGLAGSVKAKQWARVPLSMVSASVQFFYVQHYGTEPGALAGPEFWYEIRAFFVSPKGSADNYGDSAEIPVRTVAFGSIPVTATLQVSQERDQDDLPVPLRLSPHDYQQIGVPPMQRRYTVDATTMRTRMTVRIRKLVVDGVDVGLNRQCRTAGLNELELNTKKLVVNEEIGYQGSPLGKLEDEFDPTIYQYGIQGGTLQGSLDIGRFTGCSTRTGDDLSPLLTSALSDEATPVSVRVGATNCQIYDSVGGRPIPPGVNDPDDPRAGCVKSEHPNPKIVTVPKRFDLPSTPPQHVAP